MVKKKNVSNNSFFEKTKKEIDERQTGNDLYCCLTMHHELLSSATILRYNKKFREYGIKIPNSSTCALIDYCMFCGKQMPPSMRDEWFNILRRKYKLKSPMNRDEKRIPQEFLTDEWWKKYNLEKKSKKIYLYDAYNKEIDKKVEQRKSNYTGPHCCLVMHCELLSDTSTLEYNAKYREYGVIIPNASTYITMNYCVACGKKTPLSVRDEWFNILEQEYQLDDPMDDDRKRIPQEFLTDEWWKKRHL